MLHSIPASLRKRTPALTMTTYSIANYHLVGLGSPAFLACLRPPDLVSGSFLSSSSRPASAYSSPPPPPSSLEALSTALSFNPSSDRLFISASSSLLIADCEGDGGARGEGRSAG